jgi:hypothetical protein
VVVYRERGVIRGFVDPKEMDGKILYMEILTRPADGSALFFTQGYSKMSSSGGVVTVDWLVDPVSGKAKGVTFGPGDVARFERNDEKKVFIVRGATVKPDYIYLAATRAK